MFVKLKKYPNYSINENGELKSIFVSKILKPRKSKNGYFTYQLHQDEIVKNEYVHRLVAETFIPNPYNLPQVDHIDGDKSNNNVSNLRWVSQSKNMLSYGYESRVKNSFDKVSVKIKAVNETNEIIFNSQTELLKHFGYASARSHLKFNEKYNYGKLKGYTLYRL